LENERDAHEISKSERDLIEIEMRRLESMFRLKEQEVLDMRFQWQTPSTSSDMSEYVRQTIASSESTIKHMETEIYTLKHRLVDT